MNEGFHVGRSDQVEKGILLGKKRRGRPAVMKRRDEATPFAPLFLGKAGRPAGRVCA
jgi:hypothetical protein